MSSGKKDFDKLYLSERIETSCGRFKVNDLIAQGRCCVTYEGENVALKPGQPSFVALKLFSRHQDYRGALLRENMVLQALPRNRHIVTQYCHVWTGSQDILVQELLTGTVAAITAAVTSCGAPVSAWLLYTLATDSVRGLASLHDAGLIHGDIKVHNIMWSADCAAFKLIDFGLSTRSGEQYVHRVQSPEYSSPEVLAWNRHLDQQPPPHGAVLRPSQPADVWALGYTVARAAVGERLFPHGVPASQEDVDRLLTEALDRIAPSYLPSFLEDLATFIKSCLRLCADDRATAAQLTAWGSSTAAGGPQHRDLVTLPTAVLRLVNVGDAQQPATASNVASLLQHCRLYGPVSDHHCDGEALYLHYAEALDAETAFQSLHNKDWNHRTLVPTFYPPDLYHKLNGITSIS